MAPRERVDWIDVAKAVSILLVTFLHVVLLFDAAGLSLWRLKWVNSYLEPIRMPLFFTVAGVFAGKALASPWRTLLQKKVLLYAWLIVVWNVVFWVSFSEVITQPQWVGKNVEASSMFLSMLMPLSPIWFLQALAIFFIAAKLLTALPPKVGLCLATSVSLVITAFLMNHLDVVKTVPGGKGYAEFLIYFAFFFGGAAFPALVLRAGASRTVWAPLLFAICFALGAFSWMVANPAIHALFRFTASCSGVAALLIASRVVAPTLIGTPLKYIGRNTLPIYVAQYPIIAALAWPVASLNIETSRILSYAAVVICTALTVVLTLALQGTLEAVGLGWLYRLPRWRGFGQKIPPAIPGDDTILPVAKLPEVERN